VTLPSRRTCAHGFGARLTVCGRPWTRQGCLGFAVAAHLLRRDSGAVIILDGRTCSRSYEVVRAQRFARRLGQELRIIECACAEQTACDRLVADAAEARHPAANRDPRLYRALRAQADPIPGPKLDISTDQDLPSCVARCLNYLELWEQGAGRATLAPISEGTA
jgi:hypothetical protein